MLCFYREIQRTATNLGSDYEKATPLPKSTSTGRSLGVRKQGVDCQLPGRGKAEVHLVAFAVLLRWKKRLVFVCGAKGVLARPAWGDPTISGGSSISSQTHVSPEGPPEKQACLTEILWQSDTPIE